MANKLICTDCSGPYTYSAIRCISKKSKINLFVISDALITIVITGMSSPNRLENVAAIRWTVEESYGSLLAFRFSLCSVLREKIEDGYLSVNNAKDIIDKILFDNAGKIYV